jgi:hypothetical protein
MMERNLIISYFDLQGFEIWLCGKNFISLSGEKTHIMKMWIKERYEEKYKGNSYK